jgi:hypothetical protein
MAQYKEVYGPLGRRLTNELGIQATQEAGGYMNEMQQLM